ncbi:phosphoribosyltransferase-like predicted ribonucleoside biosynthesis protein [Arthrobacter sp. SLBN-100]|uniref:phosphoribosyltransferase domain-containing protein n=1 Tax=Arthrobacter sp. SLBN-100 TaxID=2768450 RepID=UPI00114DAFE9|nr:phosphoribosyltransferase domain-containing protein [Arthrobacter sp. SLBN-100]TQJ69700.1 phosphoribosyltransferase-like predicted ribonucleoside biosynthesis protein [Arthrobacter sp. SLBN-100]
MTVAESLYPDPAGSFAEWGLAVSPGSVPSLLPVTSLVGLALRRNPKRAHLLVSRVLAKHVPTEPGIATAAGLLLGLLVRDALSPLTNTLVQDAASRFEDLLAGEPTAARAGRSAAIAELCRDLRGQPALPDVATMGYAETATGLGQLVADSLGSYYIHSTRHAVDGADSVRPYVAFEESHSHATSHQLFPTRHAALSGAGTIVLVDDELTTGATIINTICALHQAAPHQHYVVASLIDLRLAADRIRLDDLAVELDCRITVVSLANGDIALPDDLPAKAALLVSQSGVGPVGAPSSGDVSVLDLTRRVNPVRSARFGINSRPESAAVAERIAEELAAVTPAAGSLLVLATEEFMALPLATAAALQDRLPGVAVRYSTSTRSPIAVIDGPGYPVRSVVTFNSHDVTADGPGRRFAYNFNHPGQRFDQVVVMAEPGTPETALIGSESIAEAASRTGASVQVVLLSSERPFPTPGQGPSFGSYQAGEVQWLIKDLSFAELEAPTAEREAAIQSGRANYAESLPEEYEPSREYEELYKEALSRSAARVAHAVGTVTEQVIALRDGTPVLVSLARAGTPVGILMKRWAKQIHGLELPHYTASIVRGVGIDQTALSYLASHYRPEQVMFVDGWTGKGAIARELATAVESFARTDGARFSPELAVLADPGHCTEIFGTRDDFLIPSACLNSTVSGLVSRTVFNRNLIFPNDFHGAKYYRQLAAKDVSGAFLDIVSERFTEVQHSVLTTAARASGEDAGPRPADWSGLAAVERISKEFGLNNTNLVKPGVGETTRVLLRRVPWKILVRSASSEDVQHVLLLARLRGVEVVYVEDLPYTCVGLIHPLHGTAPTAGTEKKAAAL